MEIHAFRLTPGQDLKKSLVAYAKGEKLEAGCIVTCVGSLKKVRDPDLFPLPRRFFRPLCPLTPIPSPPRANRRFVFAWPTRPPRTRMRL
jgi:hypothetical protein|tara:strand:+ start:748 stop:1017 length:270 start_codon:yes stop_codon:yes gene_type:complete